MVTSPQVNPLCVVAHSVTKTNIFSLLELFNYIYIAAKQSSIPSLRHVLRHFGFTKAEQEEQVKILKDCIEPFAHLLLDVETREITMTKVEDAAKPQQQQQQGKKDARATAERFLNLLDEPQKALALFDLVHPSLPQGKLNEADLTVCLKRGGGSVQVSLIEYLASLVDPEDEPDHLLQLFHEYLERRNVRLPRCFVLNRRYW